MPTASSTNTGLEARECLHARSATALLRSYLGPMPSTGSFCRKSAWSMLSVTPIEFFLSSRLARTNLRLSYKF